MSTETKTIEFISEEDLIQDNPTPAKISGDIIYTTPEKSQHLVRKENGDISIILRPTNTEGEEWVEVDQTYCFEKTKNRMDIIEKSFLLLDSI